MFFEKDVHVFPESLTYLCGLIHTRRKMDYIAHTLPNGLRMVHLPVNSPVSYCGFAVNAGTRDENEDEFGLAHFVEHMIFKGTEKRKACHILNRMELSLIHI